MNETTDKIANKLLESIQKSQSTAEQSSKQIESPAEATPKTSNPISKTKKTDVKKSNIEIQHEVESERQLPGRLRWPD